LVIYLWQIWTLVECLARELEEVSGGTKAGKEIHSASKVIKLLR
jgi:hypothetical protein